MEVYAHYQNILLCTCFVALAVILFGFTVFRIMMPAWDSVRRILPKSAINRIVLLAVAIGFIQYGATKNVSYSDGVKAAHTSNIVSNSTVHIYWQKDTSTVIVPDTATVYIDYREVGSSGAYENLGTAIVSDYEWLGTVENATNYDYYVWAYYIPPEPVHTNGVWVYKTLKDRSDKYVLPLRARVEVDGNVISTPKGKRENED